MSEYRRYTRDQLQILSQSPLCIKPDGLPSIDQWMEGAKPKDETNVSRQKRPGVREDALGENSNPLTRLASGTQLPVRRPGQVTRTAGQGAMGDFSLFPSTSSGDEVALGPPLMQFTSNSRTRNAEKSGTDKGDFQDGFFKLRNDGTKERGLGTQGTRRKDAAQNQGEEGWTSVRRRKSLQPEDDKSGGGRWDSDREAKRGVRDADTSETPGRRTGAGRGRFSEATWIRPENGTESNDREQAPRGDLRTMSWRDREAAPRERPTREWNRRQHDSNNRAGQDEEDPEWMTDDTPAPQQEEKQKHTQEDFQRWKEQQRLREQGKTGTAPPPSKANEEAAFENTSPAKPPTTSSKSAGALPTVNRFGFGVFEDVKKIEAEKAEVPQKPQLVKSKSRFDNIFKKDDLPPPPLPVAQPNPLAALLGGDGSGSAEDKAGFAKILNMLQSTSTPPNAHSGARAPPPLDQPPQTPASPAHRLHGGQSRERLSTELRQREGFMEDLLARQLSAQERNQNRQQHAPDTGFMANRPPHPSQTMRGDLQHMHLHQQNSQQTAQPNRALDPHGEFLLNLMSRQNPDPRHNQQRPNEMHDYANAQYGPPKNGLPGQPQAGHSQPHGGNQRHAPTIPPGLDPHHQRLLAEQQHQEQMRRQHGGPPGYFDHDGMPSSAVSGPMHEGMISGPPPGLARRNTADAANGGLGVRGPAQASNLGIPSNHGLPPGLNMMMMRNGPVPGGAGGPGGHHMPPPGLMTGPSPQGPRSGHPSAGPPSAGGPNNMTNGDRGNGMHPQQGSGPMGPPPGFQGMLLPGMGGQVPPNLMHGMPPHTQVNGPPMPPGFPPQMGGPPPGFFPPMGPNGMGGPGVPPSGLPPHFFGRGGFPPGFVERDVSQPQNRGGGF